MEEWRLTMNRPGKIPSGDHRPCLMRRIMHYEDFQGVLRSRYQETYAKAIVKILELKNETRLGCCAT